MAITVTKKIDETATSGTSFTSTATLAAVAGRLYIAFVLNHAGGTASAPTLSGAGLTWTQAQTVGGGSALRLTMLTGQAASGVSTQAITASFGANAQDAIHLVVLEIAGAAIDYGGSGAAAVAQAVPNNGGPGLSASATLSAFRDATNNATLVFVGVASTQATGIAPKAGFTELSDDQVGRASESQYLIGGDTAPSASWTSASDNWWIIAAEIKAFRSSILPDARARSRRALLVR